RGPAAGARRVDRGGAADHGRADPRPEPPLLVNRGRWRLLLAYESLAVSVRLLRFEVLDQPLDRLAIGRLGIQLQVLLEAEDRLFVIAEVPVALADVVQETGQRFGIEGGLVLLQRLVEAAEREQLLAALEVAPGGAGRGVIRLDRPRR